MSFSLSARFHMIGVTAFSNLIQLGGIIARHEDEAHYLQVNFLIIMRAGNSKGLGDPNVKGVLLKLAHPRRDIYSMGHK